MLLSECATGEDLNFSSTVVVSSHMASIRAKLWNDDALSKDDPSMVTDCETAAVWS